MTLQKINNYEEAIQHLAKADLKKALPSMQLLGQEYVLKFQIKKAENLYDNILLIDSTDMNISSEAEEFYKNNRKYFKVIKVYTQVTQNLKAET